MKFKKIYFLGVISCLMAMSSCSKMNDLHSGYLENGELVYAAKIDSAIVYSGQQRIQIDLLVKSQRIDWVRIFWNDYADSTDVPIHNQTGVFTKVMESLAEKSYIFHLVSIDKFGNKSLPVEVSGESYGDRYLNNLLSRSILSVQAAVTGEKIATWSRIDTTLGAKFTEILYNGQVLTTPVSRNTTVIPGYQLNQALTYRTGYLPANCIDTFYTAYKDYSTGTFPLSKTGWSILNFSSNHGGENVVAHIIDGDTNNRWHSTDDGSNGTGYPHHVTVDLGGVVNICQFGVWPSIYDLSAGQIVDVRAPTKVQFLVSTDNVTWIDMGEFPHDNTIAGEQVYPVTPTNAQYFKFVGVESTPGTNPMVLGELSVYVQ